MQHALVLLWARGQGGSLVHLRVQAMSETASIEFPHMMDPKGRPGRPKGRKTSRGHLEEVFMSRLLFAGMAPEARGLVKRIIHYGFHGGDTVQGLETALGRSRRLILYNLAKYDLPKPSRWLAACRLLYVVWIHFRLRGSFVSAIKHLGRGGEIPLYQLCNRVTGIRPSQAHAECLEANSILPFMDRCILYLLRTEETE